ncbi:LAMI_0D11100g1_1 [Lachancea mirantina]|uniref:Protein-S-isoprenylcysteine O-methyltransferase n=1 Tax=Lachancea mirantina TaxID=1230905 RepID=A0A1G4JER2_9SACH|nr:LAMI_0D11100g1_1 [Lachancea mirantina]
MSEWNEDQGLVLDGKVYPYIEKNPLDEISLNAFALGATFATALTLLPLIEFYNLSIYMASLSLFHFLEFYTTARFNPGKVTSRSFLLRNGKGYILSHVFAMCEVGIGRILSPTWKCTSYSLFHRFVFTIGLILMIIGQLARTLAMVTAGKSFSHHVKTEQNADHVLVTEGVYSSLRHPSYFGFFWWALGTQMCLLNPCSFVLFTVVLWKFFNERIEFEEKYLVQFFGQQYLHYRARVPVGIPFIK